MKNKLNLNYLFLVVSCSLMACTESAVILPDEVQSEKKLKTEETTVGQLALARLLGPNIGSCICCEGFRLEMYIEDDTVINNFESFPANTPKELLQLDYPNDYPLDVLVGLTEEYRKCDGRTFVKLDSIRIKD